VADPRVGQLVGALLIEREVDGAQFVGHQGAGVLDGAGGRPVEPVDEHEHDVTTFESEST
jgi:hypothetical protein